MASVLTVTEFLDAPGVLLDVRSPAEYQQGRIPGAISFPLFSDDERAQVGTCYKHQGRNEAVELGFAIAGPKFAGFIAQAAALAPDRRVRLHCWRGGMRSGAIAWVLELAGFQVSVLEGGYKAFRRWAMAAVHEVKPILILGGMTGTGKTDILTALAAQGEQVLDLEHLANHRGSSYGALGLPPQPSNEQFENRVGLCWAKMDRDRPVWIEAESKRIGICRIPEPLFRQMEQAPILEIERAHRERLDLLVKHYGTFERQALIVATDRIRKRLGGLRTDEAIALLRAGQLADAFDIVLSYYDKTYRYDLERRSVPRQSVDVSGLSPAAAAELLSARSLYFSSTLPLTSSCNDSGNKLMFIADLTK